MLGFGDDIHILQVMYTRMYRCTAAQQAACPSVNVLAGTGGQTEAPLRQTHTLDIMLLRIAISAQIFCSVAGCATVLFTIAIADRCAYQRPRKLVR